MTAPVILIPVIARSSFSDPSWVEQHSRECRAQCEARLAPPYRTRPLLAVNNTKSAHASQMASPERVAALAASDLKSKFDKSMLRLREVFSDDISPSHR